MCLAKLQELLALVLLPVLSANRERGGGNRVASSSSVHSCHHGLNQSDTKCKVAWVGEISEEIRKKGARERERADKIPAFFFIAKRTILLMVSSRSFHILSLFALVMAIFIIRSALEFYGL